MLLAGGCCDDVVLVATLWYLQHVWLVHTLRGHGCSALARLQRSDDNHDSMCTSFSQVAKLRAARTLWAELMKANGAKKVRSVASQACFYLCCFDYCCCSCWLMRLVACCVAAILRSQACCCARTAKHPGIPLQSKTRITTSFELPSKRWLLSWVGTLLC